MDVYRLVEDEVDIPTLAMEVVQGNRKGFFFLFIDHPNNEAFAPIMSYREIRLSQICILNITKHESNCFSLEGLEIFNCFWVTSYHLTIDVLINIGILGALI